MSNSLRFTDRDGVISVVIELNLCDDQDNKTIEIKIEDNGIGIRDMNQKSLFKLFGNV